jgi:hypothetical protein
MALPSFQQSIATHGWAVTGPLFSAAAIAELRAAIAPLAEAGRGGARNLLDEPRIAALAGHPTVRQLAAAILGESIDTCFAPRGNRRPRQPRRASFAATYSGC